MISSDCSIVPLLHCDYYLISLILSMALTRAQKAAQLTDFKESLKKAKSVVFLHYSGTTVSAISQLRTKLYEKKTKMRVGKKTLFRIAAKESGLPEVPESSLEGPVAFVFNFEDEVSGAKVALEFGKVSDKVKIIGGILNGKLLTREQALELGRMLGREELLTKFACMLRAPLSNFASLCSTPLRSFAYGLKQVSEKKTS